MTVTMMEYTSKTSFLFLLDDDDFEVNYIINRNIAVRCFSFILRRYSKWKNNFSCLPYLTVSYR